MRKSRQIVYTGNDERLKGISDLLNETSFEYIRVEDEDARVHESDSHTGIATATYKFDDSPGFPKVQCKAVDIDYGPEGLSGQGPILDLHLEQGKYCREFEYVPKNSYTKAEAYWRYNGDRAPGSSTEDYIFFNSYVSSHGNYMHYPPYTRSNGVAFQISGLNPKCVYKLDFTSVDIYPDTHHSNYNPGSMYLFYKNRPLGVLVDNSHTLSYSRDKLTGFEDLSPSLPDYSTGSRVYSSLMDFGETEEKIFYEAKYIYHNEYYETPEGSEYYSYEKYGTYEYFGQYYSFINAATPLHAKNYPFHSEPFSMKVTSSEQGTINLFLILDALTEPCRIFPFDIYISGSPDEKAFRDVLVETKNGDIYPLKNPRSQTYVGTTNPDPGFGKDGDMYVYCTEKLDNTIRVGQMPEGKRSYIWKEPRITTYGSSGDYFIYLTSNDDPDPNEIITSKYDELIHDFVTCIDEPYVCVQLENLSPGTLYHMYFRIRNKPSVRKVIPEGSSEPIEYRSCYCSTVYIGEYRIATEPPGDQNIFDIYFCPKNETETVKIVTADMHLFAVPYLNPIVADFNLYCMEAKPKGLFIKADNRWQQINTGEGGSSVIISPAYHEGVKIADYSIDSVPGELWAPNVSVVANPQGVAYDELNKLQVGGTVYSIPEGADSVSELSDVDIDPTSLDAGQVLKWDEVNEKWVNSNESGGTVVIANPSGTPTDELSSIQIGNDIYEIAGGGGSGSGRTIVSLWQNEGNTNPDTITLSKAYTNYDDFIVMCYRSANNKMEPEFYNFISDRVSVGQNFACLAWSSSSDYVTYSVTDATTFTKVNQGSHLLIKEVVGIKYSGGSGGSGSGYSITNLWSGDQRGPMEIPLSDDINNYDTIEFVTKLSTNGAYNVIVVDAKSFSTKYPYSASVSQNIPHYCLLGYDNLFGRVITGQTTSSIYIWDLSSTIRLAEVNGIKYESGGGGGTTVIPNPVGEPTEELNTIQIGDDIFEIVGNSGSGTTITPLDTEQRVTKNTLYELSDDITKYDAIFLQIYYTGGEGYPLCGSNMYMVSELLTHSRDVWVDGGNNDRALRILFASDNTHYSITGGKSADGVHGVYGIKFGSGGGSGINGVHYSTDEQVIGTWIDGKPLYQKTIVANNIYVAKNDTDSQFKHNVSNIETGLVSEIYYDHSNGGTKWVDAHNVQNYSESWAVGNTSIYVVSGEFWNAQATRYWMATIRYTKTTD